MNRGIKADFQSILDRFTYFYIITLKYIFIFIYWSYDYHKIILKYKSLVVIINVYSFGNGAC